MAGRACLSEVQVLGDLADGALECFIRRTLEEARAKGWDELTQGRPDMTASEALAAVELVRRKGPTVDELPRYRRFRADGA